MSRTTSHNKYVTRLAECQVPPWAVKVKGVLITLQNGPETPFTNSNDINGF